MFYYVYVLLSKVDDKFYVGYTQDLKLRFEQHCNGEVKSTKDRRPLQLIYSEAYLSKSDALRREKYLKTMYGRMSIRKRLKSYFNG